ncbi:MAG: H4MPT-linked C1 transfer pathway protein [Methylotenera sp. 24-45-7]|jgi:probable H4MPT-linked C1 transfer pathway protein|nr:MAG: H4MPT-linked C1 transfer pathway protein [Methylotenera sp. 24-45-7]OZA08162.1 MAG: H4MPT-linked C1 transfer pathway protein [Methylotenera sp. 17-45-7]OZA53308.1 MAG: H4MPT-linked C1 transfer pathway protein [Methylophilales bacterium 39-45-7]HQS38373.1 hydantoinase/oxoprolinase family protein [Methylotenera sp.]HQS44507.1 hydantoinase/oxoprolinase family protein [Methylotenera sp.]
MKTYIGWDIGGAHLKAVLLDAECTVLAAKQVYCPLWLGLAQLDAAITQVLAEFNAHQHVVTMTGELADIFASRQQGVTEIAQLLSTKLQGEVRYYAGKQQFVDAAMVTECWSDIASMNWLASVQFVAQNVACAMFVDIGSTTTDIACIHDAMPMVKGLTDAERMQCDELVYTGVVRTPLMAVTRQIKFGNKVSHVAAEYFATAADVYTLSGELPLDDNAAATADGADKSMTSCARRIARMVGCDVTDAPLNTWQDLALQFKQQQVNQIKQAMQNQLSQLKDRNNLQVIGAGAGSFLVAEIAAQLNYPYREVTDFIVAKHVNLKKLASVCFPAYAVAFLAVKSSKATS